jgi:probable rRNA maturation factor
MHGPVEVSVLVRRGPRERRATGRDAARAARAAATVLRRRLPPLSIAVVGDRRMRRLNRDYHGVDATTDVLAFPLEDSRGGAAGPAGEVIVCAPVAARAGRRHGHPARWELLLYVVHGVLHLLGESDARPAAALRMRRLERRALRSIGYDPGTQHVHALGDADGKVR